jgi:hypothetical protein
MNKKEKQNYDSTSQIRDTRDDDRIFLVRTSKKGKRKNMII